nr:non lysosomal glucosylceramidase [Hymenolepis microstoma]
MLGLNMVKRYVRWFSEDIHYGAIELLTYAANHWQSWRKSIIDWQVPILRDPHLPDWYKSALFNELYFVSDGGTVWLDPLPTVNNDTDEAPIDYVRRHNPNVELDPLNVTGRCEPLKSDSSFGGKCTNGGGKKKYNNETPITPLQNRISFGKEMGLFAYLEGHEYRMFNTYDVHFNASWALVQLWPKIEMAMLYDLADMTASADTTSVVFMYKGMKRQRNAQLGVPHDLGDPEDEPWVNVNAYIMYPTDDWKDLSSKFLLMAWRDWKLTGDTAFLQYVLPICLAVVKSCLEKWDSDGDGIIENSNFPDQTAYVGGLWVAALYAVSDMLSHAKDFNSRMGSISNWAPVADNFSSLLKRAKDAYQRGLWDGKFYRYDSTVRPNSRSSSVMADQLSGYWFLRMGGAPIDAIMPAESANETLKTIVELNWLSVQNGHIGAINSILSNGKNDNNNMQTEEFWVAVNYSIGSLLILHGMRSEGFRLAEACFDHVYNKMGLHFQTPEAYTKVGTYRSLGYMRPLAIWSIQRAVEMDSMPSHLHSSPPSPQPPLVIEN